MFLSPKQGLDSWGVKLTTKFQEDAASGGLAFSIFSHGMCVCMPAFFADVDAMKASGWAFLAWLPFVVKEFIQPNLISERFASLFWVVVDGLVAYVNLAK